MHYEYINFKIKMMKRTQNYHFILGLVFGFAAGVFLSSIAWRIERDKMVANLDDVRTILIQTKMRSYKDSIWYNDKILILSDLLYESSFENKELKEKLFQYDSSIK